MSDIKVFLFNFVICICMSTTRCSQILAYIKLKLLLIMAELTRLSLVIDDVELNFLKMIHENIRADALTPRPQIQIKYKKKSSYSVFIHKP